MITKKQQTKFKAVLEKRQNELIRQVQDHFGMDVEMGRDSVGELSIYDNHPGDMGTELYERQKDIALNEHAETELEEINKALHAIEEGTYGICSVCGGDIAYERLLATPVADRCIEHATEDTFHTNRPVEEQVISSDLTPKGDIEKEEVGYDREDAWQEVGRYGSSETTADFYSDRESFDEMYPNEEEETIGSVEDVEEFISSDLYGNYSGVSYNHKKYENELDDDKTRDSY